MPDSSPGLRERKKLATRAALAQAIADRTGTDVARDLYPRLVAGVVVSVTQTAFDHWRASISSGEIAFAEFLRSILRQVAAGFPVPPTSR